MYFLDDIILAQITVGTGHLNAMSFFVEIKQVIFCNKFLPN